MCLEYLSLRHPHALFFTDKMLVQGSNYTWRSTVQSNSYEIIHSKKMDSFMNNYYTQNKIHHLLLRYHEFLFLIKAFLW